MTTIGTRLFVVTVWSAALAVTPSCGGGGSPTSPSSSTALFTGTWAGTFGALGTGAGVPMTLMLTQTGASVSGTTIITCAGCGDGRSNVSGTVSGNIATVAFTDPGETAPFLRGITLTLDGTTIATRWRADDGSTITGTLTPAPGPAPTPPVSGAATITSTPSSVSLNASPGTCSSSNGCTVFQNISINSSTAWTSTVPGFGSLGEGFSVSPSTGPAGVTNVVITYRWTIPQASNGFFRFRTTTSGIYVEVPVVVNVR
jgi:hypothetical protein